VVDSTSVRLDTFVDDIEALREALGLRRVHVIAHSWGALLAMKYAIAHPNRLHSLVLLDAMPPTAALWREEERALVASIVPEDTIGGAALRTSPALLAQEPAAMKALLRHSFRSQFRDRELAEDLTFHVGEDYFERSRQFGFMINDLFAFDLIDGLREVDVPTLILYGEDEPGGSIGGDALAEAMPDVQRATIPAAGHFPFIEQPQAFLDAVRAFLAR
jgi:proline iminopeptidase